MDKKEVFEFMKAHPSSHLATVEGDAPHVRGMRIHLNDERGLIIQTAVMKDVYKQLCDNPNVELCFNDYDHGIQMRVSGKAELLHDPAVLKEVMDDRPFLKKIADEHGIDAVVLFQVKNGRAAKWTFATNLEPKNYIDL